jgi:hypothetical protein
MTALEILPAIRQLVGNTPPIGFTAHLAEKS